MGGREPGEGQQLSEPPETHASDGWTASAGLRALVVAAALAAAAIGLWRAHSQPAGQDFPPNFQPPRSCSSIAGSDVAES
jgi:hypothetical protein